MFTNPIPNIKPVNVVITIIALSLFSFSMSNLKTLACGNGWFQTPCNQTTQKAEAVFTEKNQQKLTAIVPNPELQDSVERRNLVNRLQKNNKANKIGYVFLLSDTGSVISNYTIKGKVSSLNSLLTTPDQLVSPNGGQCGMVGASTSLTCYNVASPDLDGSYGKNPDGVFFFTVEGNMIEWSGKYLYSEQPMTLTTPATLSVNVK